MTTNNQPSSKIRWWHWICGYLIAWMMAFGVHYVVGKVIPYGKKPVTVWWAAEQATFLVLGLTITMLVFRAMERSRWSTNRTSKEPNSKS